MKRSMTSVICALAAILSSGCDKGQESLARGADAEALGNFTEAAAQYRALCDKGSSLCPIAARRLERIKLEEADKALSSGEYRKAKAAVGNAIASTDEGVKRAAEAMSKLPDLEKGIAWEEASAAAKPEEALATMEGLAGAGVAVSGRAREWLAKSRPRILLDRLKAACTPAGAGSCAEIGREIERAYPTSPENTEASKLVAAEYARIFPLLQKAETLLGQASMLFVVNEKIRWCMWDKTNDAADESTLDGRNYSEPSEAQRTPCTSLVSPEPIPAIEKAWETTLAEIHDPSFTKGLGERLERAKKAGLYEAEVWAKPEGKK